MIIRIVVILLFPMMLCARQDHLLHASFDVTRELFKEINTAFIEEHNLKIKIKQSHGGSGKQASAVMHGLPADLVSLALPYHMDLLAQKGLVEKNWRELFPNNSAPLSTYIVFLVKKDNPKNIKDWDDLIKPGVKVITANPKTSGGALWNYVAAWLYAEKKFSGNKLLMQNFMQDLYHNAPILDSTARNSAITFLKRHMGDVLITWDSEAKYIISHLNSDYKIIIPSLTVKIDIPVATILTNKKEKLANEYINFLYSAKAQKIIKDFYYQPYDMKMNLTNAINVENIIKWDKFKRDHFEEHGIFEQIYK